MNSDELKHLPSDAVDSLDVLLVFNILRSHNYIEPHIDRGLANLKLTCVQLNLLLLLRAAGEEGLPLSEIGRRLVVSKANITGLVDRLEQRDLVCRDKGEDRRVITATLTLSGETLVDSIFPAHHQVFSDMVDCLTVREKKGLIVLLTKLRKGLRRKRWQADHPVAAAALGREVPS